MATVVITTIAAVVQAFFAILIYLVYRQISSIEKQRDRAKFVIQWHIYNAGSLYIVVANHGGLTSEINLLEIRTSSPFVYSVRLRGFNISNDGIINDSVLAMGPKSERRMTIPPGQTRTIVIERRDWQISEKEIFGTILVAPITGTGSLSEFSTKKKGPLGKVMEIEESVGGGSRL